MWETLTYLLWLAVPVGYALLGYRCVRQCRTELDRARSYVDDTYENLENLLTRNNGGRHHRPE
jgi:hypothetical protein